MKFFKYLVLLFLMIFFLSSCHQKTQQRWKISLQKTNQKVSVIDISKKFYDKKIPLTEFQREFPWFQGTVSDEDLKKRREDSLEISVYNEAISKINHQKFLSDLKNLFDHIKYYFPKFQYPKVYLYSSALQSVKDPVFYKQEENLLFVDISAFMGKGNKFYRWIDLYVQKSMNQENMIPKISEILAENVLLTDNNHLKFIDKIIFQGKLMILQDAFLPDVSDYLKMNYTKQQYDWSKTNEVNIWNYFVENDLIFSDDNRLEERFISPGPFSKFYTEIDNESSPQVGIFIGWQICRKLFDENPDLKLTQFLEKNSMDIFNQSKYKPKN